MEAEYIACSASVQEAVWLRRFLQRLGILTHASDPVTIYCNSMADLAYAKDPKYHGRTKHMKVRGLKRNEYITNRVSKLPLFKGRNDVYEQASVV